MEMYEELVNALRCYAKDEECYHCEYFSEAGCDIDRMLFDAADAIEELERDLKDCRNELCLRCGEYKRRHLGACDSCRWLEVE